MPNARPRGTLPGSSLSFVDWLCSFFAWQIVRDTGATIYRQNAITGARSASRITGGHQPIDQHWLQTGEWSPLPKPPTGGPIERRASIFPHFDVDVPMPSPRDRSHPVDRPGTAIIDIAPDVVALVLSHLPRAYTVIGSEQGPAGFVRLVLRSYEIAPGADVQMVGEISDVGSTRTMRLVSRDMPPADTGGVTVRPSA